MSALVLGVDVGTASTKGVLVSIDDGAVVATTSRSHELALPLPGWAEHDAETTWWHDFVASLDRYDELYGAFRWLYPATRDAAHVLARIQERTG